jgi:four helix bundle protein
MSDQQVSSLKKLIVWQKSMDVVPLVYKATQKFPPEEKFGLASQMRRAAVSIPSNIAEGSGRNTKKDFLQCIHIALGSTSELETQVDIAYRLNYIDTQIHTALTDKIVEIKKILVAFRASLVQ